MNSDTQNVFDMVWELKFRAFQFQLNNVSTTLQVTTIG
jgi:hypothetical protein